ncbi:hypothetical protein RHMOL_Rhmol07G0126500 [Rhododendron molle]|uniref:Uncharacterized protein n=1 Tax=Rhododendron molle TaxID=49168 RepID=A0ACC0N0Z0_RHOML|nr:hypothetical protein RHMOL_Rhmol07G0126500 [Rhododendron molle]
MDRGNVLCSFVLHSLRRALAGIARIGSTIGDVHRVELVEFFMCTKNQLYQISLSAHEELDELYAVNISDRWTDAGKASSEAVQHAVQHKAAQHTPPVPYPVP